MIPAKRYLGDGVYVAWDELGITLTTENGVEVTNRIVLEAEVYAALEDFVLDLERAIAEIAEGR